MWTMGSMLQVSERGSTVQGLHLRYCFDWVDALLYHVASSRWIVAVTRDRNAASFGLPTLDRIDLGGVKICSHQHRHHVKRPEEGEGEGEGDLNCLSIDHRLSITCVDTQA